MILSRESILEALDAGELSIDPFDPARLGAASYDMRLAPVFRRLHRSDEPLDVLDDIDYRKPDISEWLEVPPGGDYVLGPGETVLGITAERLALGPQLCARLEGRSRFARIGLLIHISAGFLAPGTNNHQVLEISNMAPRPLRLHPGAAICQCLFERTSGPARHEGRYRSQDLEHFRASP